MKSVCKLLLLLLLASAFVSAVPDHFIFDTTVYCDMPFNGTYYLKWEWYETDVHWLAPFNRAVVNSFDDRITPAKEMNPPFGRYSFRQEGEQDGDEWRSKVYQPKAVAYHNCNRAREIVYAVFEFYPACWIGHRVCHYRARVNITNKELYFSRLGIQYKNSMAPFDDFP